MKVKYSFDNLVNREDIGNMKYGLTPEIEKEEGLISFQGAEFDFPTAPAVIESIIKRTRNGILGYTIQDKQYNDAIIWWMKNLRNWDIQQEWIVPTLGTIHALTTTIHMLLKDGDGIIVQTPVYYRYEQAAERNNKKTFYNPLIYNESSEHNNPPYYEMDLENLEKVMARPESKLMVLCNPHNPIGQVWKEDELKHVAYLANKYDVLVFSDEIFGETTYNGNITIPYSEVPGAADNCIVATGLGKAFSLTGMNHANIIIPNEELRNRFIKQRYMDHYGSMDVMAHAALLGAYTSEGADWLKEMNSYVWENSLYLRKNIGMIIPQVSINLHEGAYLNWIDWRKLGLDEMELKRFLTHDAKISMEDGRNYGVEGIGFTRIQLATPRIQLEKAMKYLSEACAKRNFTTAC